MKKIVEYALVIFAFIVSIIFFLIFDLENILWNRYDRDIISLEKTKEERVEDYTGLEAGEGITMLSNKEDWDKVLNEIDYVSVVPKSIIKTKVYSRAKWVEAYTKKSNGSSGRRLEDVKETSFDFSADYSPYYIIELEDGTHILAQMNRGIAKRIEKGEEVKLPLGKKIGFSTKAKKLLTDICDKWEVPTDYVLYTIDNDWEAENSNRIFIEKFVISFVIFIALAVILFMISDKYIFKDENG